MDKQKVIVVLLLITIVFSVASIFLTLGVEIPGVNTQTHIIKYASPSHSSVSLVVEASETGGEAE